MTTTQQHTLASVANAFKQWRTSGKNRQRVPETLRRQTIDLLAHHRKSDILQATGINHTMLNRWSKEFVVQPPKPSPQTDQSTFVPLPVASTLEPESSSYLTTDAHSPLLTMTHPSGWALQWHRLPDEHQLRRVLSSIAQLIGGAVS